MKIFEFQFNPKTKDDRFFGVFSYEAPKEQQEKGNMYMVGELQNALPNNAQFLNRLAELIRQEYYSSEKQKQNGLQRLKNALKKANTFLTEESKKENVSWLGNLNFLLLLFVPASRQGGPASQGYTLYFAKVGSMKLWIARGGSLVDAGKSIESAKSQEVAGKVFGNVGSGKVVPRDRVIGVTQEAFDFFSKENFLQTISQFKEQKQFKSIFKSKQKEMSQLLGILFFVLVEALEQAQESNAHIPQLKLPILPIHIALPALPVPRKIPVPTISLPDISFLKQRLPFFTVSEAKKRIGLLSLLCFLLLLGFAVVGRERIKNSESLLSATGFEPKEMSEEFRVLHKITEISEPEVAVELNSSFAAANLGNIIHWGSRFYFFDVSSPNIFVFDSAVNTSEIFGTGKNLKFGTSFGDSALFFAEPNTIVSIDERNTILQHTIELFSQDSQLGGMEQFAGNLYFFDSRNGEIFKSGVPAFRQVRLEQWLDPLSSKKPINAQSMSIDGNIWILTSKNEIQRYFRGKYQESLVVSIVPAFQHAILLKTSSQLPYLYILEPVQQRLVVLNKSGELIQQYRSAVFKEVRDFVVSPNDQTIYLFSGTKLYQILPAIGGSM